MFERLVAAMRAAEQAHTEAAAALPALLDAVLFRSANLTSHYGDPDALQRAIDEWYIADAQHREAQQRATVAGMALLNAQKAYLDWCHREYGQPA